MVCGTVVSLEDDISLPGVNVIINGTSQGKVTDFDENYSISAKPDDILVFLFWDLKNKKYWWESNSIS